MAIEPELYGQFASCPCLFVCSSLLLFLFICLWHVGYSLCFVCLTVCDTSVVRLWTFHCRLLCSTMVDYSRVVSIWFLFQCLVLFHLFSVHLLFFQSYKLLHPFLLLIWSIVWIRLIIVWIPYHFNILLFCCVVL